MGPINNIQTLVQVMVWRRPGDKPLSEPMMVRLPKHIYVYIYICVTRPLNELSGFASDHRVALVVHRNLYPTRPVSDPHFRLRRWRAALGQLMLTVPIRLWPNWVNVNNLFEISKFSFMEMHLKMFAKWEPFCHGPSVSSMIPF